MTMSVVVFILSSIKLSLIQIVGHFYRSL